MTVSSTTNRVSFTGNGSTTGFSFPYYFQVKADLIVKKVLISTGAETLQVLDTDYTISGTTTNSVYVNGGTVNFVAAPSNLYKVVVYRDPTLTQSVDFIENDPMPAETLEQALDKRAIAEQRLDDRVDRAVRLPDGFTATFNPELPAIPEADATLVYNSTATGWDLGPTVTEIENAESYANAASASASAASTSASNAATSASNAATSASNAATSASNAATSASNAATSETNAAASAAAAAGAVTTHEADTTNVHGIADTSTLLVAPVANASLADMANGTIKGRTTAGAGDPEDLTGAQATALLNTFAQDLKGLTPGPTAAEIAANKFLKADGSWAVPADTDTGITQLTGDVTAGPGSGSQAATIANSAVTNAKLADVATATFKGRTTAGTGAPEDLTATQATALLNTFTQDLKGLVPGPTAAEIAANKLLRADGSWATAGTTSPLTTKGDLYTYSTTNDRLPVGTNGQILSADSAESTGLKWITSAATAPRSEIWVQDTPGYGSTNTKIRRFTNTLKSTGSSITYADSAANGASFTINTTGIYAITFTESYSGQSNFGLSLNSAQLTTSIQSITTADRLNMISSNVQELNCMFIGNLTAGDIVRAHTEGAAASTSGRVMFRIVQIAN